MPRGHRGVLYGNTPVATLQVADLNGTPASVWWWNGAWEPLPVQPPGTVFANPNGLLSPYADDGGLRLREDDNGLIPGPLRNGMPSTMSNNDPSCWADRPELFSLEARMVAWRERRQKVTSKTAFSEVTTRPVGESARPRTRLRLAGSRPG